MENKTTTVEELFIKLKEYGDTRLDLLKLKGINKVSKLLSSLITSVILLLLFILVVICLTVALSLYLGEVLGGSYFGFLIVAGIYIIIGLVLFLSKTKLIKTPISNKLIKDLMD